MNRNHSSTKALILTFIVLFLTHSLWANDKISMCDSSASYQHVIITSSALKSDTDTYSLSTFMQHRIDNGISSTIVSTDSIYQYYQGVDNQEKIRNFIIDARNNWDTEYVLLGGDVNIIPARMLYARDVNMAADMYYACLDNSFNDDGDDKWGEVNDGLDFEYDVYVGRASAENATEMHNFVYKTISYENSPLNASYHTKIIHMSQEASGIGNTEKWCDRYREKSKDMTFEYYRLTDAQADPVANNRLSNGNIGQYLGASHGYVGKIANITIGEAVKFTNADQFYFMTSIACLAGRFDQDCVAEAFCTSTRKGGAFAGMFNSEDAFPPYIVQYLYKLRDVHYVNKITKLGILRAEVAKSYAYSDYLKDDATAMARRYQAYQYNLFGDPATDLKSAISTPIDVSLSCNQLNGSSIMDESGNQNNATIHGNIDTTLLLGSKAIRLDGKINYLSIPHNAWNPMGNQVELTLAAWFYLDSLMPKVGLFVKGSTKNPFGLYLKEDGHLTFEMNKNTPANGWKNLDWTSDTELKQKGLYHLALVLEYKSSQGQLYIDGILKETFPLPTDYLLGGVEEPLYIGKNPKTADGYLKGAIDDVQIYSRSLSASEVNALMETKKPFNIVHTSIIDKVSAELYGETLKDKTEYTLDYDEIAQHPWTIKTEINTPADFSGCIVYQLDSLVLTDNDVEFSSLDIDNELYTQLNTLGHHNLSVMLFSEQNGQGYIMDEKTITIHVEKNASLINAPAINETIAISPNPAQNELRIQNSGKSQHCHLVIYAISGEQVMQNHIHLNSEYSVDISALMSGYYFLKIEKTNGVVNYRFLKN